MITLQEGLVLLATLLFGALIPVVAFIGKTWISERIRHSVAAEYNRDLEDHRDELARGSSQLSAVQSTANAALLEGQRAFAERRASAVDALWQEVLRIRDESPTAVTMLDIFLPSEYQEVFTSDRFLPLVPEWEEGYSAILNSEIDRVRPFLGERAFTLFFIYRAVHARICFLLETGVKAGEVKPWFEDAGIHQLLRTVLSGSDFQAFTELNHGHVGWMRSLIEGEILDELRKIVAGEVSTAEGFEQARRVQEIMRDVEIGDSRRTTP